MGKTRKKYTRLDRKPGVYLDIAELQRRLVELYSRAEQLLEGGAVVHVDAEQHG